MKGATERFSDRVDDYIKYRPGYPPALVGLLEERCDLAAGARVADVGSGTGLLSKIFLEHGLEVVGVEPNEAMRRAGDRLLARWPAFASVCGQAEATGLKQRSVDLVVCGQAFHWFDPAAARREFARVLKPGGQVALIWNERSSAATEFLVAYEQLLQTHCREYSRVNHRNVDEDVLNAFFAGANWSLEVFDNGQEFDFDGLRGRLLSSSYAPNSGAASEAMLAALKEVFAAHNRDGKVRFVYQTKVYWGQLGGGGD